MIQTTLDNFLNFGIEDKTIYGFRDAALLRAKLINKALAENDKDKFHTPYWHLNQLFNALREEILDAKDKLDIVYIKSDHTYMVVVYPNRDQNYCAIEIVYHLI